MKAKVMQDVENAIVNAVIDSASALDITPMQRAKFAVNVAEVLIDALAPYVHNADAAAPPERVKRVRGPRKPKLATGLPPVVTPPDNKVNSAPLEPAHRGPPAAAQPFAG